eukprot:scaffold68547_cov59-Attheya_sp.AAC.2
MPVLVHWWCVECTPHSSREPSLRGSAQYNIGGYQTNVQGGQAKNVMPNTPDPMIQIGDMDQKKVWHIVQNKAPAIAFPS